MLWPSDLWPGKVVSCAATVIQRELDPWTASSHESYVFQWQLKYIRNWTHFTYFDKQRRYLFACIVIQWNTVNHVNGTDDILHIFCHGNLKSHFMMKKGSIVKWRWIICYFYTFFNFFVKKMYISCLNNGCLDSTKQCNKDIFIQYYQTQAIH